MPLVKKFILTSIVILFAFGGVLGYALTQYIELSNLERLMETYSSYFTSDIKELLTEEDLKTPQSAEELSALKMKLDQIHFGPDVVRALIWDKGGKALWSTDKEHLAGSEVDSTALSKALAGQMSGKYRSIAEGEKVLFEIYLPIQYEETGEATAVLEIYTDARTFYSDLAMMKRIIWGGNALGVLALALALTGLINKAANQISSQNEEISRSARSYRNLLHFAQDGIVVMNNERRIIIFNKKAEMLFGWTMDHAIGGRFDELLSAKSRKDTTIVIEHLYTQTTPEQGLLMSAEGIRENGETFPIVLSMSASGSGSERLVTAIIEDVTERKEL